MARFDASCCDAVVRSVYFCPVAQWLIDARRVPNIWFLMSPWMETTSGNAVLQEVGSYSFNVLRQEGHLPLLAENVSMTFLASILAFIWYQSSQVLSFVCWECFYRSGCRTRMLWDILAVVYMHLCLQIAINRSERNIPRWLPLLAYSCSLVFLAVLTLSIMYLSFGIL